MRIGTSPMVSDPDIAEILLQKFRPLRVDYWHPVEVDSKDQQACLIDGLYQGVSEDGCLLIGDLRLRPQRDHVLVAQTEEINT